MDFPIMWHHGYTNTFAFTIIWHHGCTNTVEFARICYQGYTNTVEFTVIWHHVYTNTVDIYNDQAASQQASQSATRESLQRGFCPQCLLACPGHPEPRADLAQDLARLVTRATSV